MNMLFLLIDIFGAAVLTFVTSFFGHLVNGWQDCWIPILLYIAFFIAMVAFTFICVFAFAIPVKVTGDRKEKPSNYSWFWMDSTLRFLTVGSLARVKTEGYEKIPTDQKVVFYGNHKSNFDAICMYSKFRKKRRISFIAKRSLFHMPLIGKQLYGCGFIPIDRDNLRQAIEVINNGVYYLENNIMDVGIYPEGTRNQTDAPLLDIKPGSFKIPMKAKAPIVTVVVKNCEKIVKRFPFRPTHVYVKVMEVLMYEDYKDMTSVEICEHVKSKMLEGIEELKDYKA